MTDNSPQSLLPVTILIGFLSMLACVIVGLPAYLLGWPIVLSAFAFVLVAFGLYFLIAAWHIRQGLVHGRLVRSVANLINWIKMMKQKLER
jgi:membrane protein implicated in regulation of membrane protease activity